MTYLRDAAEREKRALERRMQRLRYADLERLGVVRNRVTLRNWIRDRGFPAGQLTGPNSRTWSEAEVQEWLDSRPTEPKPRPGQRSAERDGMTRP
jgi:predicted DNA-binding transcriptional regulator AlpA